MSSETTATAPPAAPGLLDPTLPDLVGSFPDRDRRVAAAFQALTMALPTTESEEWRYSRVGDLDLARHRPVVRPPVGAAPDPFVDAVAERAATVEIVDGWVVRVSLEASWAEQGLEVGPATATTGRSVGADESIFDVLHRALAPDALQITVRPGLRVSSPIIVLNHSTAHRAGGAPAATFPHVVVEVGADAEVSVIEYQSSASGRPGGLSVPLVELSVGPAARLSYATVQELAAGHWQIGRQSSTVAAQATLTVACASFGGDYARLRTDTTLQGRGAHGDLLAVYYGDGDQTHDFRTFQHHSAPDTTSELLFKGTVDDRSSSVYTGLIHIHPDGRGSSANQSNRTIKLSDDAWAWSVPNLEIENSDVRCSHASTVSPVDPDQRFYLHSRGVPPTVADRLIVAGFFHDVIVRMPTAIHEVIRRLVAAKLDARVLGDEVAR